MAPSRSNDNLSRLALAVVGLCAFALLASAQTSQRRYDDLIPLPGTDFVGFGFDARYEDPMQGLRLPLLSYSFDKTKNYKYPLYRDRVYKVPDQIFTRTVASTEAANYISTSIQEHQERQASKYGLQITATQSSEVRKTPKVDKKKATPFEKFAEQDGSLPGTVLTTSSKTFSSGVSYEFAKSGTNKSENYITQNDQLFQLYQLILNEATLRDSLANDIKALETKTWATDQLSFQQFFEKYGTHYVQNAMMGGAISMTSLVATTTQTDYSRNAALATLESEVKSSQTTIKSLTTDELKRDSPKCTGAQEGWAYNDLDQDCEIPPEATCLKAMDGLSESFEYDKQQWQDDLNANTNWRKGPFLAPLQVQQYRVSWVFYCVYFRIAWFFYLHCYNYPVFYYYMENLVDAFANMTDGSSAPNQKGGALEVNSNYMQYSNKDARLVYRDFTASYPGYVSFWSKTIPSAIPSGEDAWGGFLWMGSVGDKDNFKDDVEMVEFMWRGTPSNAASSLYGTNSRSLCTNTRNVGLFSGEKLNSQTVVKCALFPKSAWFETRLIIDWEKMNMKIWLNDNVGVNPRIYRPGTWNNLPMTGKAVGLERFVVWADRPFRNFYLDEILFCNDAKGGATQPVSVTAAIAASTASIRQTISGSVDYSYENSYSNVKIESTSSYKLKGGDSAQVDLLNPANKQETFDIWKRTIPINPTPVAYTLKEISFLFPGETNQETGLNPRIEMNKAIASFLTQVELGEITYDTNPDQPSLEDELIRKGISVPYS